MTDARSRLIHGFLDTCLLSLLADEPDYGLGLAQRLARAGLDDVPGGTLYPALLRLEKRAWVTASQRPSDSGPPRKYFVLTDEGRAALADRRAEWAEFVRTMGALIDPTVSVGETLGRERP